MSLPRALQAMAAKDEDIDEEILRPTGLPDVPGAPVTELTPTKIPVSEEIYEDSQSEAGGPEEPEEQKGLTGKEQIIVKIANLQEKHETDVKILQNAIKDLKQNQRQAQQERTDPTGKEQEEFGEVVKRVKEENEKLFEKVEKVEKSLKDGYHQKEKLENRVATLETIIKTTENQTETMQNDIKEMENKVLVASERAEISINDAMDAKNNSERTEDVMKTCSYDIKNAEKVIQDLNRVVQNSEKDIKKLKSVHKSEPQEEEFETDRTAPEHERYGAQ